MRGFEIVMLLCFGASWPVSLWKSYTSGTTRGKSVFFLFLIFFGYLSGIGFKVTGNLDGVVFFYLLNAVMVLADIVLFFRNRRRERAAAAVDGTDRPGEGQSGRRIG